MVGKTLALLSRVAAPVAGGVGLCVLLGWMIWARVLVAISPGLARMKANTAFCFVLVAGMLWLAQHKRERLRGWELALARSAAALVIAGGVLTLLEYTTGWNLGIDELLVKDRLRATQTTFAGRMAPHTALNFVLAGLALTLQRSRHKLAARLSRNFARLTGAIALVALIGSIYSVASFYRLAPYTAMAVHTSALFILLSVGILLNDPASELSEMRTSNSLEAVMQRRLLPAALLVPLIVGWILTEGRKAGLYGTEFGLAIFTTANVVIFFVVVLSSGRIVGRVELERNKAERALRESSETLHSVIRTSPMAIVGMDGEQRVCIWNEAAEHIFGWTEREVLGKPYPLVQEEEWEDFRKGLKDQAEGMTIRSHETQRTHKDGKKVQVRLSAAAFRDQNEKVAGWVGLLEDVTEQKLLEAQYRQAQKMEAIGQLVGGIAHDFNNVLGVVVGSAEVLAESLKPGDAGARYLGDILSASSRATGLVKQLLAFTRQQVLEPRVLVANETVRGIESMLRRVIGENIELHDSLAPDLWRVKVDPGQLEQVVLNLAVNARDAMPEGGKLIIETKNIVADELYGRTHKGMQPGAYVMLCVSDTGTGMDAVTQSRIFEPFFTTKEKGKGTGLGLSTVYGIVQQSGGHIWVYSEVGRGTAFKIYFPRTEEMAVVEAPMPAPATAPGGDEKIMLVEDEDSLRALGCEILRQSGYEVLEAAGPKEALELVEKNGQAIDLLMTDVIMPGMSGHALAELLKPRFAGLRILYVSGYTDDAIARHGVLEPGVEFLQKPYTRSALTQKIRSMLDAGRLAPEGGTQEETKESE